MNPQKNEDRKYKITGRHVRIALHRDRKQRKQEQRNWFDDVYDELKEVKFKSRKMVNMKRYFGCPRLSSIPEPTDWNLTAYRNALAVYPVLCSRADHADDSKPVRLSRENIAKLAGISPNTVDTALPVLEQFTFAINNEVVVPFLSRRKVQHGRRRIWEYYPGFIRRSRYDEDDPDNKLRIDQWKGNWFPFHTCIIESGVWAALSPKPRALYFAMRSASYFDSYLYEQLTGIFIPEIDPDIGPVETDLYGERKWEICNRSLTALFELAGIPYNSTKEIITELEEHGLIDRLHDTKSVFQVWLRPQRMGKRS